MNTTDQRLLLQLARRGLAASSENLPSGDALQAWRAIAALEYEFKAAMEQHTQPMKDPTNG